jgi:hypothetical protein
MCAHAFRYGTTSEYWKETEMGWWFGPEFRDFEQRDIALGFG